MICQEYDFRHFNRALHGNEQAAEQGSGFPVAITIPVGVGERCLNRAISYIAPFAFN